MKRQSKIVIQELDAFMNPKNIYLSRKSFLNLKYQSQSLSPQLSPILNQPKPTIGAPAKIVNKNKQSDILDNNNKISNPSKDPVQPQQKLNISGEKTLPIQINLSEQQRKSEQQLHQLIHEPLAQPNTPLSLISKSLQQKFKADEKLSQQLNNNHFFQEMRNKLDEGTYEKLLNEIQIRSFRHFDIIFQYGDIGDSFYIILEGEVFVLGPINQKVADRINENKKKQKEAEILEKQKREEMLKQIPKHRKNIFLDTQEELEKQEYNRIMEEKAKEKLFQEQLQLLNQTNVDVDMPFLKSPQLSQGLAEIREKQISDLSQKQQQQQQQDDLSSNSNGGNYRINNNKQQQKIFQSPNILNVYQANQKSTFQLKNDETNSSKQQQQQKSRNSISRSSFTGENNNNNDSFDTNNNNNNNNKLSAQENSKQQQQSLINKKNQILLKVLSKAVNSNNNSNTRKSADHGEIRNEQDALNSSNTLKQFDSPAYATPQVQSQSKPKIQRGATIMNIYTTLGSRHKFPEKQQQQQLQIQSEKGEIRPSPTTATNNNNKLQLFDEQFSINHVTECYPDFKIIRTLTSGESFGELALRLNQDRTASIVCKTDCKMAILSKDSYNRILDNHYKIQLNEKVNFIKNVNCFKDVAFETIAGIVMHLKKRTYTLGQLIYKEGEKDDKLYFVLSGQIQLSKNVPKNPLNQNPFEEQTQQQKIQAINKLIVNKSSNKKEDDKLQNPANFSNRALSPQTQLALKNNSEPSSQQLTLPNQLSQGQPQPQPQKAQQQLSSPTPTNNNEVVMPQQKSWLLEKQDPRQPRILMTTKCQYEIFGEVEIMQNIPRFTRAECLTSIAEVYRISKQKFFNNLGSFRILQRLEQGSQNIDQWRVQLYKQISNKVILKKDPLQETFQNIGQAKRLIQEKFKQDFIKNSNNLLFKNKSKQETETTAKNIYFQQIRLYMNKLSDVRNAICKIKKIENSDIDLIRGRTNNLIQQAQIQKQKSQSLYTSPVQSQRQSDRSSNNISSNNLIAPILSHREQQPSFSRQQQNCQSLDNSMSTNTLILRRKQSEPQIQLNLNSQDQSIDYQQVLFDQQSSTDQIPSKQQILNNQQQQQQIHQNISDKTDFFNDNYSNLEYICNYNIKSSTTNNSPQNQHYTKQNQQQTEKQSNVMSNQISSTLQQSHSGHSVGRLNLSSPLSQRMNSQIASNLSCIEDLKINNKNNQKKILNKQKQTSSMQLLQQKQQLSLEQSDNNATQATQNMVDMNGIYKLIFSGKITPILQQKEKLDPEIMKRKIYLHARQQYMPSLDRYLHKNELSSFDENQQSSILSHIKKKNQYRHLQLEKVLSYKYLEDAKLQIKDGIPAKQMKIESQIILPKILNKKKLNLRQIKKQKSEEKIQTENYDFPEQQEQQNVEEEEGNQDVQQ